MKDLQQDDYFETLASLSYLKEYSELFDERYQKAIDVAYHYIRDSLPRILSETELNDLLYEIDESEDPDEPPVWIEGIDAYGGPINCYAVLKERFRKENGYSEIECMLTMTRAGWTHVHIDDYGKTWIAWTRKPLEYQLGKYLKGKDK